MPGVPDALLRLADRAERRKTDILGRVLCKLDRALSTVIDVSPLPETKQ